MRPSAARGALSVQVPQYLSPDVVSCGHCSPNFCVDHSYSGFIFIRFFPLPPWCDHLAVWRTSAFRGWRGLESREGAARVWRWVVVDVKTEAVVKILFLSLFLTRHFFFFC